MNQACAKCGEETGRECRPRPPGLPLCKSCYADMVTEYRRKKKDEAKRIVERIEEARGKHDDTSRQKGSPETT